jgi:uncharacterized protein YutE (UPF0331/DUF86 family)
MNDVVINKIQSIQRCIQRAREEYNLAGDSFKKNHTHQDAAILNITRACEQTIDLANYVIKNKKYGIPTQSRDSFDFLVEHGLITSELAEKLVKMTGFRITAVHQYQKLDIDIVINIIKKDLDDLIKFCDLILDFLQ